MYQSKYQGITVGAKRVQRGYYSAERPFRFIAEADFYFGSLNSGPRMIPKGSLCKFFETDAAGVLLWTEPNGDTHMARE